MMASMDVVSSASCTIHDKESKPENDEVADAMPIAELEVNQQDAMETSILRAMKTVCFEGLDDRRLVFVVTTPLLHSSVTSLKVTERMLDSRGRPEKTVSSHGRRKINSEPHSNQSHVYAESINPRKERKVGKNRRDKVSFLRRLPSLQVPKRRLNAQLLEERNIFMEQLQREREEKVKLESWAAIKIQRFYRANRKIYKRRSYPVRQTIVGAQSIRMDLREFERSMSTPASPAEEDYSPMWRKTIRRRAERKREVKRQQAIALRAVALINWNLKKFITRCRRKREETSRQRELHMRAVCRIQSVTRGRLHRIRMDKIVSDLKEAAAIRIQALVRGILARERTSLLKFDKSLQQNGKHRVTFALPARFNPSQFASFDRFKTIERKDSRKLYTEEEHAMVRLHWISRKLDTIDEVIQHKIALERSATMQQVNAKDRQRAPIETESTKES